MIVSVEIKDRDRKIGAMVKALAVEVAGFAAVKGTKNEELDRLGAFDFDFPSEAKAIEFREAVARYLPGFLAQAKGR